MILVLSFLPDYFQALTESVRPACSWVSEGDSAMCRYWFAEDAIRNLLREALHGTKTNHALGLLSLVLPP